MKVKNSIIFLGLIGGGVFGLLQAYNWLHKQNKNEDNYYLQGPGKGDYLYLSAVNFDNKTITKTSHKLSQEAKSKIKKTKYEISQLKKKEQKINNSLINLNDSIILMVSKIEQLSKEKESCNNEYQQYDEQIKLEQDEIDILHQQTDEIQNQMQKNQKSIDQTNSDRMVYVQIIETITKKIFHLKQNEIQLNKNIEDINNNKQQSQLIINLNKSQVEAAKNKLNNHNKSIQQKTHEILESINYLDSLDQQLIMYDEDIIKLQKLININNALILSKENLIKNQQQIIIENNKKIITLQNKLFRIKGFSTSTAKIKYDIAREEKKQKDIKRQLSLPRLNSLLKPNLQQELLASQQKSNNLSTELPRLESQMEKIKKGFSAEIEQEKHLLKQLEEVNLQIHSEIKEKETLTAETKALQENMKQLLVLKKEQEEQITKLEQDKQKLQDQQKNLLSAYPEINNNYLSLSQELNSVSKKYTSIESDLNTAQQEMVNFNLKITALEQEKNQTQSLINEKISESNKHLTMHGDSEYKLKVNAQKIKDKKLTAYFQEEIMVQKTKEKSNLTNLIKKSQKSLQTLNKLKTQTIAVQDLLQNQIHSSTDLINHLTKEQANTNI